LWYNRFRFKNKKRGMLGMKYIKSGENIVKVGKDFFGNGNVYTQNLVACELCGDKLCCTYDYRIKSKDRPINNGDYSKVETIGKKILYYQRVHGTWGFPVAVI
jgi:hypothetical protein